MEDSNNKFMKICIKIAKIALENGNPPVGAIIVNNGQVLGVGIESGRSTGDITNHAEILAVKDAISNGKGNVLNESVMYTTHEPCIMCSYVIRHYKLPKIVYSVPVNFIGGNTSKFSVLKTEDVPKWGKVPKIVSGICELESQNLNFEFEELLNKKQE